MLKIANRLPGHFITGEFWSKAGIFFFCITLFIISFPRKWSLYSLGATLGAGLAIWIIKFRYLFPLFIKEICLLLPLTLYFILYFLWYLTFPEWQSLEVSLMFILVPVSGFPLFISDRFRENIMTFFRFFVLGLAVICSFELIRAVWTSFSVTDGSLSFNPVIDFSISATSDDYFSATSRFRSAQLSFLEHPIYLSLKLIFAIVLMVESRKNIKISKLVRFLLISFFMVFLYLLSSRIGYIILISILIYFLYKLLTTKRLSWILIILIPLLVYSAYKISILNPRIHQKTDLLIKNYKDGQGTLKDLDPRFISWFTAIRLISENPFIGLGPGSRDFLASEYAKEGFSNEAALRLNAHNQYLESQLMFGIPGTIVLLWMILTLFIRRKYSVVSRMVIPFLIIITVSMLFESILVRQWGIMFFVLFYCILLIPDNKAVTSAMR